jgi:hypothetical protein
MKAERERARLLKQHGFVLVRETRHKIYRNPEGKTFVTPSTPSDARGVFNSLSDLKRVIAQPPMCELLAIADHEKREQLRREQQTAREAAQALAKKRNGGGYGKGHGTGFTYIDHGVQLTPEEKKVQAERRQQEAEDDKLARQERQRLAALGKVFVEELLPVEMDRAEQKSREGVAFADYVLDNFEAAFDTLMSMTEKAKQEDTYIETEYNLTDRTLESAAKFIVELAIRTGSGRRLESEAFQKNFSSWHAKCKACIDDPACRANVQNVLRVVLTRFWKERIKHGRVSERTKKEIESRTKQGLLDSHFPISPGIDFTPWAAAAKRLLETEPTPEAPGQSEMALLVPTGGTLQ